MWKCEKCGSDKIEEVMENVTVTSECWVEDDEVCYGEQTNSGDSDEIRYQCSNCGKVLKGVKHQDDLIEFLKNFS